ncbi:DNA polymerase IV [Patescibacteria group bacterium]|nr:DNA polymerase IV [Patescibacteria group bacterium]MBU1867890.1 DNA polymerase IV [Patescibacteria group bacterium]
MPPLSIHSFPSAILHVDGDSFFASCEQALNPKLKDKPVVVGKERGIATAASYEAKSKGVKRGMRVSEIKKLCPNCIFLPANFETYGLFSQRMNNIVRRYTPEVEEYSIDECFANLSGLRRPLKMSYSKIAARIKKVLEIELGITFSLGLAPTKVIAKIASNWNKPSSLTVIPGKDIHLYLENLPLERIWGIGHQTSAYLKKLGVYTALEFASQSEKWINSNLTKPHQQIWQELQGISVLPVEHQTQRNYQSITRSRTFTPPSNDKDFILAKLSQNIEAACAKARRHQLAASQIFFYIKTQEFKYYGAQIKLKQATNFPGRILNLIEKYLPQLFSPHKLYRTTSITLSKLKSNNRTQMDLFGQAQQSIKLAKIYQGIDRLTSKYGKQTIFLSSSLNPHAVNKHSYQPLKQNVALSGKYMRKKLNLPFLGETR